MTERELIELAAKAAGISGQFLEDGGFWLNGDRTPDNSTDWNPKDRDGDSFRLAVKCDIAFGRSANTWWARWEFSDKVFRENSEKDGVQDHFAAARLAILRVAADIGKGLS